MNDQSEAMTIARCTHCGGLRGQFLYVYGCICDTPPVPLEHDAVEFGCGFLFCDGFESSSQKPISWDQIFRKASDDKA